MTVPLDVLKLASQEIGYTEWPPGTNDTKFGNWYGINGSQWCAIFVSYCFYVAELPLTAETQKGFLYCPSGVEWFKLKGLFFDTPKVGDVVFYDWNKGARPCTPEDGNNAVCSDAWHVGIVESVNDNGSITAIEGNTEVGNNDNGGKVMRRERYPDVWYGFGRPAYSSQANPPQEEHPQWPGRYITLTSPYTKGDDVRLWKRQMIARDWNLGTGDEDIFDRRAYQVLQQFQQEKEFEVDGKIGPISWNAAWEISVHKDMALDVPDGSLDEILSDCSEIDNCEL